MPRRSAPEARQSALLFLILIRRIAHPEGTFCRLRRAEARCAGVVRRLVVLRARCAGVVRRLVVLRARGGQPSRVLRVVQIKARYAGRDHVLRVIPTKRPLCRVWYPAGVVGACGWHISDGDRDAEHAYAADRFAREIVRF